MRRHPTRLRTLCTLLALAALTASCGLTGPREPPLERAEFAGLDANGDGVLERHEIGERQRLLDAWDQIDADGDGRINPSEFKVWEGVEAAP